MAGFNFRKLVNDSSDLLKTGAQKAQEAAKNVDFQAVKNEAASKGKATADFLKQKKDEAARAVAEAKAKKDEIHGMITVEGSLRLMTLVMAADGEIADDEMAEIRDIGNELQPNFSEYHESLVEECVGLVKNIDRDEFQEDLYVVVWNVIQQSLNARGAGVPVKLLLWDLLAVANSDGEYTDDEARLLKFIAKKLDVDKSILPEMENSVRALNAVEDEIIWLKKTDRPFSVVEPVLNELSDRKAAIMQGVRMLIND